MAKTYASAKHAAVYPSHLQSPAVEAARKPFAAAPANDASTPQSKVRYRVYLIGRGIEVGSVEEIVARGDEDAMAAARALVETHPAGHWSGFTLIGPMARVVSTWRR
jgi:hypothetical protein